MPVAPPSFQPPRIQAREYGYDQSMRKADPRLAQAAKIRSSKRWQRLRALVLSKQPLCADIYGDHARTGQAVLAQQVDHIQELAKHPELAFVESNLQGLCTSCHARKSQAERSMGVGTVYLIGGPPAAGKSTYVAKRKRAGDMVLDIDRLLAALNGTDFNHPRDLQNRKDEQLLGYAITAYEAIVDQIHRLPVPYDIYVLSTLAEAGRRMQLAQTLRAETLMLLPPPEVCYRHLSTDPQRASYAAQWRVVIADWWQRYEPAAGERCLTTF